MSQLVNCTQCGQLYVKNVFRDSCEACYKEEERIFQLVYRFLRQRKNRTATIKQVSKGTGVSEEIIYKFIKKGRLHISNFPNLNYPCIRCGEQAFNGRLCRECRHNLQYETILQNEQHNKQKEGLVKIHTYQIKEEDE